MKVGEVIFLIGIAAFFLQIWLICQPAFRCVFGYTYLIFFTVMTLHMLHPRKNILTQRLNQFISALELSGTSFRKPFLA